MIQPLSTTTEKFYKYVGKPILFKIAPDTVHQALVRTGAALQHSRVFRKAIQTSWSYSDTALLSQTIHGITFNNPVGLSAGFDKNFRLPLLMKSIGFGFMEGGSVTFEPCEGNPKPWFYRLPASKSLVVHAGLANDGVAVIVRRIQKYNATLLADFPLNISVAKTNSPHTCSDAEAVADYIGSLRYIKQSAGGSMVTLNISCPNTYGGEPFTTPARLELLLASVDRLHLRQPVFIKMPSHLSWHEFHGLLQVIARHHVDGLTIGNRAKDRSKVVLKDPLPNHIQGGLSGKPTQKATNDLIRKTRLTYGDRFIIVGVGGIFTAEDAYEKIRLGANLVELITGMIFEGPQCIGQINKGIATMLERDGYKNVADAVGTMI